MWALKQREKRKCCYVKLVSLGQRDLQCYHIWVIAIWAKKELAGKWVPLLEERNLHRMIYVIIVFWFNNKNEWIENFTYIIVSIYQNATWHWTYSCKSFSTFRPKYKNTSIKFIFLHSRWANKENLYCNKNTILVAPPLHSLSLVFTYYGLLRLEGPPVTILTFYLQIMNR